MFKVDLPLDPREKAKIEARRNRDEQRKSRIFDAKQRTMGLDIESLNAQVEEKKRREAEERDFHAAADAETLRHAKIMELLHQRQTADRRAMEKADLEFRATQQLAATRREFDLNDPDVLKKATLTREGDEDPRLGVSSLQMFQGEDLASKERKRLQAEQQRQWLQEQRNIEAEKRAADEQEQRALELQQLQQTVRLRDLSVAEETRRRELERATAEHNKQLIEARAAAEAQRWTAEQEQDSKDQLAAYYGSLLSEDHGAAQPAAGGTVRVLSDRYKGMTDAQRAEFRATQLSQIEENKKRQEEARQEDALHDKYTQLIDRTLQLRDRDSARSRRDFARQQNELNAALAAEQKARRDHENKIAARNAIDTSFHDQFNRDAR